MTAVGFNPHLLQQTTEITTRAALYEEDGKWRYLSSKNEEELVAETKLLDKLVQRSIGSFDVCLANVKPKKRKADSPETGETSVVAPFRLVSSVLPPRPISLLPAYYCSIPHQRPTEDTPDEERLRQIQAQEVAVDADWVLGHSGTDKLRDHRAVTKTFHPIASGVDPLQLPNLLIAERTRPTVNTSLAKGGRSGGIRSCPLLVAEPAQHDTPHKRKRRRKTSPRDRPPPRFFRPMQDWGGKSAGYAMGWQGSWPVHGSESYGYVRDKMRKG